jgi:hypothetical protein
MNRKRVIVSGTSQYDPAKALVGSSPFTGDMTSTGIVLPAAPTLSQARRYLARLFALEVAQDEFIIIEALHQLLTIGVLLDVGDELDPTQYPLELPVTDPTWNFIDGNVSWHLRRIEPQQYVSTTYYDVPFPAPFASDRTGMTSAILARIPAPYLPLNSGSPYGKPIGSLGTFRDIRYPWTQVTANLKQRVDGPCQVVLYASIWQTNPDTRVQPPVEADGTYLRPEDRFVINHPQSRYWRIAGRMEVDVYTKSDPLARA